MKRSLGKAAAALLGANRIALACHVNPDGDTLGSVLALTHALRGLGKEAVPLSHDGVPDILQWMPGAEWVERESSRRDFDLAVICDTAALDRIGRSRAAVESAPKTVVIDHHVAEGDFGDIRVVDTGAAATGELVFSLLGALNAPIDGPIAQCLLCAIITDTGSYRYMNVTPATFHISAELMSHGACPAAIAELVFENRSLGSLKLLGRALDSLQTDESGRIAWARIRASDFEALGASDEETEGIVSHVRAVKSARAGVFFREVPGKKVRISLRAREGFDVNKVANVFGGGGHRLAAGCSLDPPLEDAERAVIAEIKRQMLLTSDDTT
jgi:bifunctional oligoribonuclease and PAP phosphatase NrnA